MTEAPLTHAGTAYRLTNLTGAFKPVQRPHPPFVIGGGGRRLLSLAAQEADIISIMPASKADGAGLDDADASAPSFDRKVALIKEAAGDRFPSLQLNTLVQSVVVTDNRRQAAEKMAGEWEVTIDQLLESPLLLIGTIEQIVEQLHARRQRFGLSYITIFERDLASFAPVLERMRAASA